MTPAVAHRLLVRRLAGLVQSVPPIHHQWVSWRRLPSHVPLAARLAAVLPSPLRYRVIDPGDWVRGRVDWILHEMHQFGPGCLAEAWPATVTP